MAKFYAVVLQNDTDGIFSTWDEAQKFIRTCPNSAKYKRFDTKAMAEDYISTIKAGQITTHNTTTNPEMLNEDISEEHAIAFVDGSFNPDTNTWGYGIVFFPSNDKSKMQTLCGSGTAYAHTRNIAGELSATMKAVSMAIKGGFKRITIYYDYAGIMAWATGAWSANQECTRKYAEWINGKRDFIDIVFAHTKGHTGIEYNEMADQLAKKGCNVA